MDAGAQIAAELLDEPRELSGAPALARDGAVQSLARLPVGAEAVVREVGCERGVARRLMEMGLLPGTAVKVVRVAPLGDPLELRVRSYALSIRRSEAEAVRVERR